MSNQYTVNPKEIAYFSGVASTWWDEDSQFGALLKFNKLRIPFLKKMIHQCGQTEFNRAHILDVGCGGGYLSEYIAREGAKRVVGIDASSHMIQVRLF